MGIPARPDNGNENVVKLLVEKGANISMRNNDGETALSMALCNGRFSVGTYLAPLTIPNTSIPYSGAPVSSFLPKHEKYGGFVANIIPIYINRSVGDPAFGFAMQRDIEKILGEKDRNPLTVESMTFLAKLLKTLRSIDYTDQFGVPEQSRQSKMFASKNADGRVQQKSGEELVSGYDMEL